MGWACRADGGLSLERQCPGVVTGPPRQAGMGTSRATTRIVAQGGNVVKECREKLGLFKTQNGAERVANCVTFVSDFRSGCPVRISASWGRK